MVSVGGIFVEVHYGVGELESRLGMLASIGSRPTTRGNPRVGLGRWCDAGRVVAGTLLRLSGIDADFTGNWDTDAPELNHDTGCS